MKNYCWNWVQSVPKKMNKLMNGRNCWVTWIVLIVLAVSLVLTSPSSPPVIKRQVLMDVGVITMQVIRRGKRDEGGNTVASSARNSQSCDNGTVSAGLRFYRAYIFQLETTAIFRTWHSVHTHMNWPHIDQ